jgi:hypothetical protein
MISRREFFGAIAAAGVGPALQAGRARLLHDRFPDLWRHFVFEYYPWYATSPVRHWDQWDRHPPIDLASNYMPRLGAYDSRDTRVLEQHARWIADLGIGAINVSWWGQGDDTDRAVPALMDVMAAHDIHVTFHIEPYSERRTANYVRDIEYLIKEYGDRRHWDCFLLLKDAAGHAGPVFKSFFTFVSATTTDCHGVRTDNPAFVPDSFWRQQTDRVRELFGGDFDRITLLADTTTVEPATWADIARNASARDLVFSFNVNPGFDSIAQRTVDRESCYRPAPFEPGGTVFDWSRPSDHEAAAAASLSRISESFHTTLALQTNTALANVKKGFFLTYINSFNEWHEGHQFEPMKDAAALTRDERAVGYHNPVDGGYRWKRLGDLLAELDL